VYLHEVLPKNLILAERLTFGHVFHTTLAPRAFTTIRNRPFILGLRLVRLHGRFRPPQGIAIDTTSPHRGCVSKLSMIALLSPSVDEINLWLGRKQNEQ
jgi:hypothetical protein